MLMLASTWDPRGELSRFARLLPQFRDVYSGLVIVVPPAVDPLVMSALSEMVMREKTEYPWRIIVVETPEWSWGRFLALKTAVELNPDYIQYADCDRLLRWVETRPAEWRRIAEICQRPDCLVIGRTSAAYATHPQALVQTEAISNCVVSFWLGRPMDVSAGIKSFSGQAARFLVQNTKPGEALGTDAEWPILLHRAGFQVDYLEVDGLDWESADRYRDRAADPESQREAAQAYDADPQNWAHRAAIALEIVQAGLKAASREMPPSMR